MSLAGKNSTFETRLPVDAATGAMTQVRTFTNLAHGQLASLLALDGALYAMSPVVTTATT